MKITLSCFVALVLGVLGIVRADLSESLKSGAIDIKQAGPMAFGPEGILFVGDNQQGAIYAIATGETSGDASKASVNVKGIDKQIAAMLGTVASDILINDVAANPASGNVYLSIARGRGNNSQPAIVRVDGSGKLSEVKLAEAKFAKTVLNNAATAGNQRNQAITDLAYDHGKVIVAGLSNEEFSSKLRTLDFPFGRSDGASVEIFHGNHGRLETRSPVRTFVTLDIAGSPNVLAAYTCTPLVTFPIAELKGGAKVTGKTVAELGAQNSPLDMIEYKKDGKDYLLVANTSRGVMKVSMEEIGSVPAIKARVGGIAGLKYDTIDSLKDVQQLDKLNDQSAVLLVAPKGGEAELKTIALP